MFHVSGTRGGDHRDGDFFPEVVDKLDVKTAVGDFFVNTFD